MPESAVFYLLNVRTIYLQINEKGRAYKKGGKMSKRLEISINIWAILGFIAAVRDITWLPWSTERASLIVLGVVITGFIAFKAASTAAKIMVRCREREMLYAVAVVLYGITVFAAIKTGIVRYDSLAGQLLLTAGDIFAVSLFLQMFVLY